MGMISCTGCGGRFDFNDVPAPLPKEQEEAPLCARCGGWRKPLKVRDGRVLYRPLSPRQRRRRG